MDCKRDPNFPIQAASSSTPPSRAISASQQVSSSPQLRSLDRGEESGLVSVLSLFS